MKITLIATLVFATLTSSASDPGHHLQVADIEGFEAEHGRIPEGSVVFVRSDWSKRWPDPALATTRASQASRSMR